MLTAIRGTYENGVVMLEEQFPAKQKMEVIVTFIGKLPETKKKRQAGVLSGKVWMSEDFDEPLI
jgi:hypothetical protein